MQADADAAFLERCAAILAVTLRGLAVIAQRVGFDALQLAIELASKGSRNERYEAMRMLSDAGSPKAFDALVDIADDSYDTVILSRTLQTMLEPEFVLQQMARVAERMIVSVPNFGYYPNGCGWAWAAGCR